VNEWITAYAGLIGVAAINAILALSQYVVLRAGVFSIATAGFASIGAYAAANTAQRWGWPSAGGIAFATVLAALVGVLVALPLARLRGVFQAIATVAFVQIVLSVAQNATALTGGALGLNGIPKLVGTPGLLLLTACCTYVLWAVGRSGTGRAWDAIRQDETVAVSLGISVFRLHLLAFAVSGALGGLAGALDAYHTYSLTPDQFGFRLLVACLTFVVLGGRVSVWGPLAGAAILTVLPELARPFKDYALLVHGALLMAVIIYLPDGVADTLAQLWRRRVLARRMAGVTRGVVHGAPVA
jgi:branched-chain amino acid transport system permease protein